MKQEICKLCGDMNQNHHHCSGKKAYKKGQDDIKTFIKSLMFNDEVNEYYKTLLGSEDIANKFVEYILNKLP